MNIETTTCISHEHLELLTLHANNHSMSLRTFISCLISFAAHCDTVQVQYFKQVKYRNRNSGNWKRFHLVLYNDEYEFFMDVKKLWKMSLARIIEYCLDNVLDDFLKFLTKAEEDEDYYTDNYRYGGYAFETGTKENIFYITLYWGPHPEILQKAMT
ncbi:MAG: hypothetical protein GYA16_09340 [Spirochaetes bacterium]|nr:hypothetical protein [Spirochaetota bacterium]NMB65056.1 hypothetical protein [Spirochaetota bacterium]